MFDKAAASGTVEAREHQELDRNTGLFQDECVDTVNMSGSLQILLKTGGKCPAVPAAAKLGGAEKTAALGALQEQLDSAMAVPSLPPINDKLIEAWDIDKEGLARVSTCFIVLRNVDVAKKQVWVEFVPFNECTADVYGWSYRWDTPVHLPMLVDIEVLSHEAPTKLLYRTRVFEKELSMLSADVTKYRKVWIDKICVPQKYEHALSYQIPAMGVFYQKATSILRDVRHPAGQDGLPLYDYLQRAWTYQETRWGKVFLDLEPPLPLARQWVDMLFGRDFVGSVQGILYAVANVMAKELDSKTGSGGVTHTAVHHCMGSGKFVSWYIKNFRKHDGFPSWPARDQNWRALELLEQLPPSLDKELKDAWASLKRDENGTSLAGPDPRQDPQMGGRIWRELAKLRSKVELEPNETYVAENLVEMCCRVAKYPADRFNGTWAVLLTTLGIEFSKDKEGRLLSNATWCKIAKEWRGGILAEPSTTFMLYGLSDKAGMLPPGIELPSGITGRGIATMSVKELKVERVVRGIGDGSVDEDAPFEGILNTYAIHIGQDRTISLLVRDILGTDPCLYRRVLAVGRDLPHKAPEVFGLLCKGLSAHIIGELIGAQEIAVKTKTPLPRVMDHVRSMLQITDYLRALNAGATFKAASNWEVQGAGFGDEHTTYSKKISSKFNHDQQERSYEFTPLRDLYFGYQKMARTKCGRFWTKVETVKVMVAGSS